MSASRMVSMRRAVNNAMSSRSTATMAKASTCTKSRDWPMTAVRMFSGGAGQFGREAVFILGLDIIGGVLAGAFAGALRDPEIGLLGILRQGFGAGDVTE